jgi:hypothetical protein
MSIIVDYSRTAPETGTLLAIVRATCAELGLSRPSIVAESNDNTSLQMLALINRLTTTLVSDYDWQFLAREERFQTITYQYTGSTVDGSSQVTMADVTGLSTDFMLSGEGIETDTFITGIDGDVITLSIPASSTGSSLLTFGQAKYTVPSGYDRLENDTMYNKGNRWAVLGPKTAQEWQWIKSSWASAGPMMRFRIMGNSLTLWPMPSSVLTIGYEYISNHSVIQYDGVTKSKFTADDDTSYFPDNLMIAGLKLKFLQSKGFDFGYAQDDYQRELSKFKAQNAGAEKLNLAPREADRLLTTANLPDSGYGSV